MASEFQLKIKEIKGESQKDNAAGAMQIDEWTYGMTGSVDVTTFSPSGKIRAGELVLIKRTDRATPALYQCCAENILLSEVTLVGQKASAGNKKIDFLTITLSKARVRAIATKLSLDTDKWPKETVSLVYQKIQIEYSEQGPDASKQGPGIFTYSFNADV